MKNYIKSTLLLLAVLFLGSCSKEDIPMTSTVDLAGEWMVTCDVIVGEDVYEDGYGLGQMLWITYNTNADNGQELWINDLKSFWNPPTVAKLPCNVADRTFGSDAAVDLGDDVYVTIWDGKITPNGAVTPSGMPADKIEFYASYSDDYPGYSYYFHGYRRTGFVADE